MLVTFVNNLIVINKMFIKIVIVLFLIDFAVAFEQNYTAFGYHKKLGVPRYKEIWETENNFDTSRIVGGCASGLGDVPFQVSNAC